MEVFVNLIIYLFVFAIIFYLAKYILTALEADPKVTKFILAGLAFIYLLFILGVFFDWAYVPRYRFTK